MFLSSNPIYPSCSVLTWRSNSPSACSIILSHFRTTLATLTDTGTQKRILKPQLPRPIACSIRRVSLDSLLLALAQSRW